MIEVDAESLYYLAARLGGNLVLGMSDPYEARPQSTIDAGLRRAEHDLGELGYLRLEGDRVVIDDSLARMVEAIVRPVASVLVSSARADAEQETRAFHVSFERCVELSCRERRYKLRDIRDLDELCERIGSFIGISSQTPAPTGIEHVEVEALNRAIGAARNGDPVAVGAVLPRGASASLAPALAECIRQSWVNGAVVAIGPGEVEWQVHGFGTLYCDSWGWLLRPVDEPRDGRVEMVPCGAGQLHDEIRRCVSTYLPTVWWASPSPASDDKHG